MIIGQIVRATVQQIENFGISFNFQGVEILVMIPEVSWERISHPSEVAKIGEEHPILILRIETGKISGSMKQADPEGNPWKEPSKFTVGTKHSATVINNLSYGSFLKISNGPEALLKKENGGGNMKVGETLKVEVIYSEPPYKLEVKKKSCTKI